MHHKTHLTNNKTIQSKGLEIMRDIESTDRVCNVVDLKIKIKFDKDNLYDSYVHAILKNFIYETKSFYQNIY